MARVHILSEGAGGALARYYTVDWAILPNLAMDLIVPPLTALMPVQDAGRLFLALTLFLLASGTAALHAALHGRLSWWPLIAFLFLWNRIFLNGFINYLFTLGLALWAVAAWIRWRERPAAFRLPVFAAIALVLFIGHLFALGAYALAVLGYEFARRRGRGWDRPTLARDLTVALGQFVVPAALLFLGSPSGDYATAIAYNEEFLRHKARGIHHLFLNYNVWFDRATFVVVAGALIVGLATRRVLIHPYMRLALGSFLVVYLLMPDFLFGSAGADYRLPVAFVFLLVAASAPAPRGLPYPGLIAAALLALFVVRMGLIGERYLEFSRVYDDFAEMVREEIPAGATMVTATARMPDYHGEFYRPQLMYLSGIAIIERSVFDPSFAIFADPGKQPVQLTPEYQRIVDHLAAGLALAGVEITRRMTHTPPLELLLPSGAAGAGDALGDDDGSLDGLLGAFDYMLLLYAGDGVAVSAPGLRPVRIHPRFQLYRVQGAPVDGLPGS